MLGLFLYHFFNDPKLMGVQFFLSIEYASMVYSVNPDMTVHMDNVVVLQYDAYMVDDPFVIIKKG